MASPMDDGRVNLQSSGNGIGAINNANPINVQEEPGEPGEAHMSPEEEAIPALTEEFQQIHPSEPESPSILGLLNVPQLGFTIWEDPEPAADISPNAPNPAPAGNERRMTGPVRTFHPEPVHPRDIDPNETYFMLDMHSPRHNIFRIRGSNVPRASEVLGHTQAYRRWVAHGLEGYQEVIYSDESASTVYPEVALSWERTENEAMQRPQARIPLGPLPNFMNYNPPQE